MIPSTDSSQTADKNEENNPEGFFTQEHRQKIYKDFNLNEIDDYTFELNCDFEVEERIEVDEERKVEEETQLKNDLEKIQGEIDETINKPDFEVHFENQIIEEQIPFYEEDHVRRKKIIKRYECLFCSDMFMSEYELQSHRQEWHASHHQQEIKQEPVDIDGDKNKIANECGICWEFFGGKINLEKHEREWHSERTKIRGKSEESTSISNKSSPIPKETFESRILRSHERHQCGICQKEYTYKGSFKKHMQTKHLKEDQDKNGTKEKKWKSAKKVLYCQICK